jgi:transcriptional regulator with XRE-family HTH domain
MQVGILAPMDVHSDDGAEGLARVVGRALRLAREKRGLSQEHLAMDAGYTREYIGLLERGRKNLTLLAVFRLAQVLAIAPSELVRDVEEELRAQAKLPPTGC